MLTLSAPPLNVLGPALRAALDAAVAEAEADPDVQAVVITAAGRGFSPGLDLSEIGEIAAADELSALCARIEALSKPVVVALHGAVMGAAAELSLAAHARIAAPDLRLGWRDVLLGLAPSSGATQRLPRIVGAAQSLRLLLGATLVDAHEALALGLVDAIAAGDLIEEALALAISLADRPPRRTADRTDGLRDPRGFLVAIAKARETERDARLPAPAAIIRCVEAAQLLPFAQGLVVERTTALDLAETPEAAALRHALVAEMAAARPPAIIATAKARPTRHLGIIGAGTGGIGLTLAALRSGQAVTIVETTPALRQAVADQIAGWQDAAVAAGQLAPEARAAQAARLSIIADEAALGAPEVVVLGPAAAMTGRGDAVLLRLGGIARAHAALGLAMPASGHGIAEIQAGPDHDPAEIATALQLFRRLGMRTLFTTPTLGGVGYRLTAAVQLATGHLHRQGIAADPIALAAARWVRLPPLPTTAEAPSRAMSESEISSRILGALAAEGLRLMARGIVARASDVDYVAVASNGFPRWEGGPMYQADRRGLLLLRRDLKLWSLEHPIWTPDAILDQLIADGTGFGVRPEDRLI